MQPADIEAVKNAAAEGAAEAIRKAKAAGIAEAEAKCAEDLAEISKRFEALEAEQKRLTAARVALEQDLAAFEPDEAKQKELEARIAELDRQIAANEGEQQAGQPGRAR